MRTGFLTIYSIFIESIIDPYIAFAGAAWTDRPNVQTLSTAIPSHYHYLDTQTKYDLARHLKALRQALPLLRTYYTELIATGPSSAGLNLPNATVPYPCSFSSSNFIRNILLMIPREKVTISSFLANFKMVIAKRSASTSTRALRLEGQGAQTSRG